MPSYSALENLFSIQLWLCNSYSVTTCSPVKLGKKMFDLSCVSLLCPVCKLWCVNKLLLMPLWWHLAIYEVRSNPNRLDSYLHSTSYSKQDAEIENTFGYMMRKSMKTGFSYLLTVSQQLRPKLATSCNPFLSRDFSLWTQCQGKMSSLLWEKPSPTLPVCWKTFTNHQR